MQINESGEMYLENIYVLSKKNPAVRSIDIANYSGYSKPSVSRAVGILKDKKLITIDPDGFIQFTKEGRAIASDIYEKHTFLTKFFVNIGVDEEIAAKDACRIEHYISSETFEALKKYAENVK